MVCCMQDIMYMQLQLSYPSSNTPMSWLFPKLLVRHYRPSVSTIHQEKILAIRSELSDLGVSTGRSRAKRNGLHSGTEGIGLAEAIRKLRAADLEINCGYKSVVGTIGDNSNNSASDEIKTFGHNSLIFNAQIKLLKEQ